MLFIWNNDRCSLIFAIFLHQGFPLAWNILFLLQNQAKLQNSLASNLQSYWTKLLFRSSSWNIWIQKLLHHMEPAFYWSKIHENLQCLHVGKILKNFLIIWFSTTKLRFEGVFQNYNYVCLRVDQTQAIIFLKSMSDGVGSDIERLWMLSRSRNSAQLYFRAMYVGSASFRHWIPK